MEPCKPYAVGEEPTAQEAVTPARVARPDRRSKPKQSTGDRFRTLNNFVDFTMGALLRADIVVWLILFRDSKEGTARTAQTDMARRGKMTRRTVGRSIRRLEARGLLKRVYRGGFRRGVSVYRVRGVPADDT